MGLEITLDAEAILVKESAHGGPEYYLSIESTSYLIGGELMGNVPKKREEITLTAGQYEELRRTYGDEPFNIKAPLTFVPKVKLAPKKEVIRICLPPRPQKVA